MLKKTAVLSGLFLSTALFLSGCVSSPKSQFIDANQTLLKADTYAFESVTNIDFSTFFSLPQEEKDVMDAVKGSKVYISGTVNKPIDQYEYTFAMKNKKETLFRFPILFTPKAIYFKTNGLTNVPLFSKNQNDSLVEATYKNYPAYDKAASSLFASYNAVSNSLITSVAKLPEESFLPVDISDKEKEAGVKKKVQVTLTKEAYQAFAQDAYNTFLQAYIKLPNMNVPKSELEASQARFNNSLDVLDIDDVRLITTIGKNGEVMSNQLIIGSRAAVNDRNFKTVLHTSVVYKQINGTVSFSINPAKERKTDIENIFLPF